MHGSRETERRVKELAAALKAEPGSLAKRLELAVALRDAGHDAEAIDLYRAVAVAYAADGRLAQAIAAGRGILEVDPERRDALELLASLAQRRARERGDDADGPAPVPGDDDASGDFARAEDTATRLVQELLEAAPASAPSAAAPPFPLLSELPRAALLELLARLSVLRLANGVTVLREGDPGDACYLIASGTVRVVKTGVEVARLGPGSFFGEFAVLCDQRRHASVLTATPVEILEIRRALLDELVAAHPGVARTLSAFYRERLLETLVATAPFFRELAPTERRAVSDRFRLRRFGRGAQIVEEGAPGGGLFLVLLGEVEVVRGAGEAQVKLGSIGEGSYFGEMSLLGNGVASATVRALRTTEAVQLPARDFYDVVSQHPVLWSELRAEAERRELANHAILAGEARQSADGSIYLV